MDTDRARLEDLLLQQATTALDARETEELARLVRSDPAAAAALEREIADTLATTWSASAPAAPLPDALRRRLLADAHRVLDEPHTEPRPARGPRRWAWFTGGLGWAVAAVLAIGLPQVPERTEPAATGAAAAEVAAASAAPADARRALLADARDALLVAWARSSVDGYRSAGGDVVWSDRAQRGFLRFVDLPPNDPARGQYQLWIVDPDRDAEPVDGGVFDVTASGETVVAFTPRLPVEGPAAFAVTFEQPGGVVVSENPRLLVAVAS